MSSNQPRRPSWLELDDEPVDLPADGVGERPRTDRVALWEEIRAVDVYLYGLTTAIASLSEDFHGAGTSQHFEELIEAVALSGLTDRVRLVPSNSGQHTPVERQDGTPSTSPYRVTEESMKTTKRTIELELPASIATLTAGLDVRQLYPGWASAQKALDDAMERLETARAEVRGLSEKVERLALDAARNSNVSIGPYEAERQQLRSREALLPAFQRVLDLAKKDLSDARTAAIDASAAEVQRRQNLLNAAGALLLAQLAQLDEMERALGAAAASLPNHPGLPLMSCGSFRDQQLVGAAAR